MKPIAIPCLQRPPARILALTAPTAVSAARGNETWRELDTLMDVFLKVRETYVDEVDDKTLVEGAINGMLASLDPHSSYLDARDSENMRSQTDGEYGGLGLTSLQRGWRRARGVAPPMKRRPRAPASSRATISPISTTS
jgi:carboxyl-terminal processing protease